MEKLQPIHFYRGVIFGGALLVVGLLWKQPIIALILLLIFLTEMNRTFRWQFIKTSLICTLLGPLAEAVAIALHAWTYPRPQLLGFPLWLAPLWGIAGLFFIAVEHLLGESTGRE